MNIDFSDIPNFVSIKWYIDKYGVYYIEKLIFNEKMLSQIGMMMNMRIDEQSLLR